MTTSRIRPAAVAELRHRVRGQIVQWGDAEYDEARAVYNAMHDRWPALVVRVEKSEDVCATIDFARSHGLQIAVRGGNHSMPGFGSCDDGLVIDLSRLRRVEVIEQTRVARVGGGCTWADLNDATHPFGLATTGGLISSTGVAGLTLGGGIGYLSRHCGLACDNLLSADLVTAAGEQLTCNEHRNADLFWALRGGGGNFGVVTTFEFRLHRVNHVLGGPVFYPLDAQVLRAYRDFLPRAPEQLGLVLGLTLGPPLPILPEGWHGEPVAVALACWTGSIEEGEQVLKPLDAWAPVLARNIGPMPYPVINTLFDSLLPHGLRHYWKSQFVRNISDEAIDAHLDHAAHAPSVESGIFFYPVDGACHPVAADATAFTPRDAAFAVGIHGSWRDAADDERNVRWVRECDEAVWPFACAGEYVNFMSDSTQGVAASYGANLRRLVEVKRRYDPNNLFCLNQNIEPNLEPKGEEHDLFLDGSR